MESHPTRFIIKYTQKISAIRILDTELFPVWLTVSADLIGNTPITSNEFKLGLAKIDFWFTKIVQNSFMFSCDNEWVFEMNPPSNLPLASPYEPTNDVLTLLFSCKANALANGAFNVEFMTVEDDSSTISLTYADEELPDLPTFKGSEAYFKHPWWNRDDSSTFDIAPSDDDDAPDIADFCFSLDFLKDGLHGPAEVIRPSFKPTVIPGKKK